MTTFKVTHTDDYREGPALYTEKLSDSSDDDDDESSSDEEYTISYEIDIKKTTNYVIYYIYMGIGDCKLKKLAERETKEEAEEFAKQQYKLYTGDYPFITSGYNSAYHPEGERKAFHIDEEQECLIPKGNDDGHDHLIISNGNYIETHSLNHFAVW